MEKTIQELCREAKQCQGLTLQDIADIADVPVSSVNNFFSAASKQPSLHLAGCICAALGVSIDRAFQITSTATPQELHEKDIHIARLEGQVEQLRRFILHNEQREKKQRVSAIAMSLLVAAMIAVVVFYMFFDARFPNAGLIQGGSISVTALLIIAVTAAAAFFAGRSLLHTFRDAGKNTPPPPDEEAHNG